jgi:hypothetical protein
MASTEGEYVSAYAKSAYQREATEKARRAHSVSVQPELHTHARKMNMSTHKGREAERKRERKGGREGWREGESGEFS